MKKSIYVIVVVFAFSVVSTANAQLEKYQVTFLYNFTRLIQWPDLYKEPAFIIGVIGKNSQLAKVLKANMGSRTAGGRPINIVEFNSADEVKYCHMLFIPNGSLKKFDVIKSKLTGKSVLYVTESENGAPAGSIINLFVKDGKMVFTLNEDLAKANKLLVSSQLKNFAQN
ncbi:YfiR family protein [Geofilum sp. OHC36d9]|uniref:YfiR family protein n=1 Tax=Geofilum sp. OHC36d9 TaxID=3458413 RepID=UPI0040332298